MALRWGIASAGRICHDFATAVGTLPTGYHRIVAVAAREHVKAAAFAQLHGIERAYEGYERLAGDPDVDVVYVGTVNPQHHRIVLLMLQHGKHVLCEKPLCMNERQTVECIAVARERKLFLMEAIWSRFFPAYQYLRQQIRSGALGEVREVVMELGHTFGDLDRWTKKDTGAGAVINLGVYTIQLSQWCFGRPPIGIKATGHQLNADGCDTEMQAELTYSDGGVARMATSSVRRMSKVAVVRGTKGTIRLPDFWCPIRLTDIDGTEKTWPLPAAKHEFNNTNSAGLAFEAEEVRRCVRAGRTQSEMVSHDESVLIARIADTIRRQIGVSYAEDEIGKKP